MGEAVEVWRGGVESWECDAMGHLNVGYYVAKAVEALAGMAAELGMPHAFSAHAEATLIVRDLHIRFLREAHAGARLHIDSGVLEMGEDDARILLVMRHGSGKIAASFQAVVAHATSREGRPFPWPARVRARAEALQVEVPEGAGPRSISLDPVESQARLPRALELGMKRIGLGVIEPADCDPFGRMRTNVLMAKISASVAHLFDGQLAETAGSGRRVGGVALEYRLLHLRWPRIGDRFELRSSAAGGDPRVRRVVHWFLDPLSGEAWGAAEATIAAFDLDERKIITLTDAEVATWNAAGIPSLTL